MYYKPFFVEGYNGKYIAIPVDVYDENGEVDEEKLAEDEMSSSKVMMRTRFMSSRTKME